MSYDHNLVPYYSLARKVNLATWNSMDRRFNCQYSSRPKCHHGNGAGAGNLGNHGPGNHSNHGPGNHGNWWESVLTPPMSANSLQSSQVGISFAQFGDWGVGGNCDS